MQPKIEVRFLTESDAPAWWKLRQEALERDPLAFGRALGEDPDVEGIARRLRGLSEQSFYIGAFDKGRQVAMASFIRDTGIKERHKGRIYAVYVTESHRNKGLARTLLVNLLNRAKQDPSLEQIILAVGAAQEAAKNLYLSLGFRVFGTEPNALKVGQTYVDELYMILRIR